ncbi:MAG: NUDIX domain-containing protein [Chloroflexi bacterium]|nr:NUDIX domain-containing protein [Chloroflexota bacterium]
MEDLLHDWTGAPVAGMPEKIHVGTSAVVFDEHGRLLLQQREDNRHWAMPGGRLDPGEDLQTCAVREVFEETGLRVRVKRLVGLYSNPREFSIARYPDGTITQTVNACFECEIVGGTLTISHESVAIGFYELGALPVPLLLTHKIRIADALQRQNTPFVR